MTTKNMYRKSAWLDKIDPSSLIKRHNPVYSYDVRRLDLPPSIPHASLKWTFNAMILPLAVWGVFVLLALIFRTYVPAVVELVGHLIVLFVLMAVVNMITLDMMATNSALQTIDHDRGQGRWSLLRISGMRMKRIIQAKHTVAQLHIWQSLCVITGFRLAVLLMIPAHMLILHIAFPEFTLFEPVDIAMPTITEPASLAVIAIPAYLIVGGVWLTEPLWRIRALIAASLVAAGASTENGMRTLAITRMMLRLNLECTTLFIIVFSALYVGVLGGNAPAICVACILPLLIYTRYQSLTRFWLKRAEDRLGELEE